MRYAESRGYLLTTNARLSRRRRRLYVLGLDRGLDGAAFGVVKCFVEEKDVGDCQIKIGELAAQLLEGMRPEMPANQGAQVFGAQIHFDGTAAAQWKRQKSHRPLMMAHGATPLVGLFH